MITVVLMEPKNSGNIGALARVMKNFELERLSLIDPKVDHLSRIAKNRAKHAQDILKNVKVVTKKTLSSFDYLIGTTALVGSDYNIPRSGLTPSILANKINHLKKNKKINIGLLFGREGNGLTNEEVRFCDATVTIPASLQYGTLNISHAAAILFYELFGTSRKSTTTSHLLPVSGKEKKYLFKQIDGLLKTLDYTTQEKLATQRLLWRRILGKAMLTKREAFALFGFFRKIKKK